MKLCFMVAIWQLMMVAEGWTSNSFISPHSTDTNPAEPPESPSISSKETKHNIETAPMQTIEAHHRHARSADPILSKTHPHQGDDLLIFKNVEDLVGNDVELSGRSVTFIQPSKTDKLISNPERFFQTISQQGEGRGALQGRSLEEPQMSSSATQKPTVNSTSHPRQANPDIQDIITGIVKLLNGNVNVQANTAPTVASRPLRPLSTRINNRGPPRITDLPALPPDFDVPSAPLPPMTTRPPYPFDIPPTNISPIIRPLHQERPGLYKPVTIPPWTRRRSTKRPNVVVPQYKPMPTDVSFTSERPSEDILTLDLGSQFEDSEDLDKTVENVTSSTEGSKEVDKEIEEFEKNKEKKQKTSKVVSVTPTVKEEILATPISLITSIEPSTTSQTSSTEAVPTSISSVSLESSIQEIVEQTSTISSQQLNATQELNITSTASYKPRPGIVLDDTEYKPGGINRQQPIITRPPLSAIGDIFDVTVSAIQGGAAETSSGGQGQPYVIPEIGSDVITTPVGSEGFVSIDGKRTYLNLFGDSTTVKPSSATDQVIVQGTSFVDAKKPNYGSVKPAQRRPGYGRPRPTQQPPVRIDTCIVGDDSTCDATQHEICRTESGVSACHCRPGTARRKHRDPCRKIVSVLVSLRVDRIYEHRIIWTTELLEKSSSNFEQLSYEAERALESAMSMTPFSDEYLGSKVNNVYQGDRTQGQAGVFVNLTLQLEENANTARPSVRADIQKHLLGVIQRRSNNVGNSALWVDSPAGSVSSLQDLDECSSSDLHDCHTNANCINVFGSFKCECLEGFRDPWADNRHRSGRECLSCPGTHCNNRGECKYSNNQEVCTCSGNYYGNQCELDGEVLGVAIGASVAAIIIIGLTLVCLVMWSRKWSREQKAAAVGSPVFGYMATTGNPVKTPVVGAPPYQLTLEDRVRWAQIADVMAQANHYAPEPGLTRPSSAMFGYPTLPMNSTMQRHPAASVYSVPPVPLPRLNLQMASKAASVQSIRPAMDSSSSEEEDKVDLLGRNFQVPRPKSRSNASVANQSGIYYDVDYDQNNDIYKPCGIPLRMFGGTKLFHIGGEDNDIWLYDDFHAGRKSPVTSL